MKKYKFRPTFLVILLILLMLPACSQKNDNTAISEDAQKICGSWAYTHDKEKAVAVFREDGSAQYEDKNYSFECDGQFITLTNTDSETIKLRYVLDDKEMYIYSNNTYSFSGDGEPDGLVGEWTCAEKNWTYSFTKDGTFLEDGYFPGKYTVDNENSTFKLVYDDQFEDTECYFQLNGSMLQIEYPWRMVKMSDK